MASLRKKPRSPYWFACYTTPDGRRTQRSTKQTNRKTAQAVADKYEAAAKLGSQKRLGEVQARRVLADIYEAVAGERLLSATTRDYLTRWAESRKADTTGRTQAAYAQVVRDFIASLGTRADMDISQVSKADVATYRNTVLARTSAASANKVVKFLRVAFGAAHKDGFMQENPATMVDTLKRPTADRQQRRAFTLPELRRILEAASDEWRGIILFGIYTGQRLGDIARLTWANVDTGRKELRFVTTKTGRRMQIPIASTLIAHIATMDAGDAPDAPLFPKAAAELAKFGKAAPLSKQFHALLVSVGLVPPWESNGKGRHGPRTLNPVSFHSLRHTATSLLKNAGVSAVVAMDIIGHDSEAVSRHYTHVDESAKHAAIAGLPDLLAVSDDMSDAGKPPAKGAKRKGRGGAGQGRENAL